MLIKTCITYQKFSNKNGSNHLIQVKRPQEKSNILDLISVKYLINIDD